MKILLVCSGGMSTSMLVEAMKKEAASRNLDQGIEAIALTALPDKTQDAACVLVAPQVRHRMKSVEETAAKFGKPVGLIDPQAYGRIDGRAVLDQALKLIRP